MGVMTQRAGRGRFTRKLWAMALTVSLLVTTMGGSILSAEAAASLSSPASMGAFAAFSRILDEVLPAPGAPALPEATSPLATAMAALSPPQLAGGSGVPRPDDYQLPPFPTQQSPHPADRVNPKTGEISLSTTDLAVPSLGPDIKLSRTYVGGSSPEGLLGPGWSFSLDQWLQMYADFNITEYRGGGSWNTYLFHPAQEGEYVGSFDGDTLIYYDLDAGHYEADSPSNQAELVRVSPDRYEVRRPDGSLLAYQGYRAPWREGQDPTAGRLVEIRDADGNAISLAYDDQGRLVAATGPSGVQITFHYEDLRFTGRLTGFTGPLGRRWSYSYNDEGRLASVTGPDGAVRSYQYDAEGLLEGISSPDSGTITLTRDDDGRIVRVSADGFEPVTFTYNEAEDGGLIVLRTDPGGGEYSWQYNADGELTGRTEPNGAHYTFTYNDKGYLTQKTGPAGTWEMEYDEQGRVIRTTDPAGRVEVREYNETLGVLTRIVDFEKNEITRTYDSKGHLLSETRPGALTTSWEYNEQGLAVKRVDPDGSAWFYGYDAAGNVTSVKDPLGRVARHEYDLAGRVVRMSTPEGLVATYEYDAGDRLVSYTAPGGSKTTYNYDQAGRLITTTNALGQTTRSSYDEAGRLAVLTDALGHRWWFSYDGLGRLTRARSPLGDEFGWQYDEMGRLIQHSRPGGFTVTYRHDDRGQIVEGEGPDGTFMIDRDAFGRIVAVTDPSGATTSYEYNERGQLAAEVNAGGGRTAYVYDEASRLLVVTSPAGRKISYDYDAMGRVLSITDPAGNRRSFAYDAAGQLLHETDPQNAITVYAYDRDGRLKSVVDPVGARTLYEYNAAGQLLAVTDALGHKTSLHHDAIGQLVKVAGPDCATRRWKYDAMGRVTAVIEPEGLETSFSYDALGRLVSMTSPLGGTTSLDYDSAAGSTTLIDPAGGTWTYGFDAMGRLTIQGDPEGGTLRYTYNARGDLIEVVDQVGNPTTYLRDALGLVTAVTYASGAVESFGYDADGLITTRTDALGRTTTTTYNPRGLPTEVTAASGGVTRLSYDDAGRVIAITDPVGQKTSFYYDLAGRLVTLRGPGGEAETFSYNALGQLTQSTDPAGYSTGYEYDSYGRRIATIDAKGRRWTTRYDGAGRPVAYEDPLGHETLIAYAADGRKVEVTDPLGAVTTQHYDESGRLIAEVNALGKRWEYSYNRRGLLEAATDPLGSTTSLDYDPRGLQTAITDPLGRITSFSYDSMGQLTAVSDPAGHITAYGYDAAGQLVSVTDPLGHTTEYQYNELGNLSAVTDANGHTTSWDYDLAGRAVSKTDPLENTWTYTYNIRGLLDTVMDPSGETTRYLYDPRGLTAAVTYSDGISETFSYDETGNFTRAASPDADLRFGYDAADRMISVRWDELDKTALFEYDAAGQRTATIDPEGRHLSYRYNTLGQIAAFIDPDGYETAFSYDDAGRLQRVAYPSGVTEERLYDDAGQLTDLITRGPEGLIESFTYSYDPRGLKTAQVEEDEAATLWHYDAAGRLVRVEYPTAKINAISAGQENTIQRYRPGEGNGEDDLTGSIPMPSVTIAANPGGGKGGGSQGGGSQGGAPSAPSGQDKRPERGIPPGLADRLLAGASPEEVTPDYTLPVRDWVEYQYDAVGNRVLERSPLGETAYLYDPANRLLEAGDTSYSYSAAGNRVQKAAPDEVVSYDYDAAGRLREVSYEDESGVSYGYDALGRRVTRSASFWTLKGGGPSEQGLAHGKGWGQQVAQSRLRLETETTHYFWDGMKVLTEYTGEGAPLAEYYSASDRILARKMFGLHGRQEPGAPTMQTTGGLLYYNYDGLGNVSALTDRLGQVAARYRYDAFGGLLTSATAPYNLIGAFGKEYDPAANLIYFGARWYDAQTGRFTSPDPYQGSIQDPMSMHRYLYAKASPPNYVDRWGYHSIPGEEVDTWKILLEDFHTSYYVLFARLFTGEERNRHLGTWIEETDTHRRQVAEYGHQHKYWYFIRVGFREADDSWTFEERLWESWSTKYTWTRVIWEEEKVTGKRDQLVGNPHVGLSPPSTGSHGPSGEDLLEPWLQTDYSDMMEMVGQPVGRGWITAGGASSYLVPEDDVFNPSYLSRSWYSGQSGTRSVIGASSTHLVANRQGDLIEPYGVSGVADGDLQRSTWTVAFALVLEGSSVRIVGFEEAAVFLWIPDKGIRAYDSTSGVLGLALGDAVAASVAVVMNVDSFSDYEGTSIGVNVQGSFFNVGADVLGRDERDRPMFQFYAGINTPTQWAISTKVTTTRRFVNRGITDNLPVDLTPDP